MKAIYQTPLFLPQIIALLQAKNVQNIIDGTYGEGGHGLNLAKLKFKVLGIEWDPKMYHEAKKNIQELKLNQQIQLVNDNYRHLEAIVEKSGFLPQAIILDLGLSMRQIALSTRGFSIHEESVLDLRINPFETQETGAEYLNRISKNELKDFCLSYIESKEAMQIFQLMERGRLSKKLTTVADLKAIIYRLPMIKKFAAEQILRMILQGLRIVVNQEKSNLIQALQGAEKVLKKQGLLIVLTFQSFEDRTVKLFFKNNPLFLEVYKKPLFQKQYRFAKGAKLRAYVKTK